MLTKMLITFPRYMFGPRIVHVTPVALPFGFSENSVTLFDSNGRRKSSLIVTCEADASTISIRPAPALLFPSHAYAAPLPLAGPLCVFFIAGSSFSHGDQEFHRWKSASSGVIFSGGALMVALRTMVNVSGSVAA